MLLLKRRILLRIALRRKSSRAKEVPAMTRPPRLLANELIGPMAEAWQIALPRKLSGRFAQFGVRRALECCFSSEKVRELLAHGLLSPLLACFKPLVEFSLYTMD
jgi:hypothetical protein